MLPEEFNSTGWADPRVIVAIYAAIVSTIALAWNVVSTIKKKTRRVKATFSFAFNSIQNRAMGEMSPPEAMLVMTAVNYSEETVHLEKPRLQLNHKIDFDGLSSNHLEIVRIIDGGNVYPFSLSKGQTLKEEKYIRDLLRTFDNVGKKKQSKIAF